MIVAVLVTVSCRKCRCGTSFFGAGDSSLTKRKRRPDQGVKRAAVDLPGLPCGPYVPANQGDCVQ